jgi:hypothetical protein
MADDWRNTPLRKQRFAIFAKIVTVLLKALLFFWVHIVDLHEGLCTRLYKFYIQDELRVSSIRCQFCALIFHPAEEISSLASSGGTTEIPVESCGIFDVTNSPTPQSPTEMATQA